MWERAGVAVDPGSPVAVNVTYDSTGTQVLLNATGTGTSRQVALTAVQTAQLDNLRLDWTAADGSKLTTYAEIVGGYMFSVAQARARSPLQDTTAYPTSAILDYRTLAEVALEDICGVSFVPRYTREEMAIAGYGIITGSRRKIRVVRQITSFQSNQQVPMPSLSGLQIIMGQRIYMPTLWNWYTSPIYCAYEHGYAEPPPRVRNAALLLARRWLVESPWDERATGFRTRDGGEMTIMTGSHSNAFDIPEVLAIADAYGMPAVA